jgi:hypothetical protein
MEEQKQHGQDELEDLIFTCDLIIPLTLFDFYDQVFWLWVTGHNTHVPQPGFHFLTPFDVYERYAWFTEWLMRGR